MIPVEKLKAVKSIITHEHCPDGVASAMILKQVLPYAKVTFVNYNTPVLANLTPSEGMLFCDFAPVRERTAEFVEAGAICLDHHKTQKDVVEAFGDLGVFGDEVADPGVCGAVLAYREVFLPLAESRPPNAAPAYIKEFATLAGIRDTWQKQDPRWIQACEQAEALTFWPEEELLKTTDILRWADRMALGSVLFDRRLKHAQRSAENGYRFTSSKGTRVVVFEGVRASSDASEYLKDGADLVIGFATHAEAGKPTVIYSTRSYTTFDCAALCKSFGGGGHTKAAGFTVFLQPQEVHPFYLIERLLNEYESAT